MRATTWVVSASFLLSAWTIFGLMGCDKHPVNSQPSDAALPTPKPELTIDLGGGVKMELVLVRPGSFMMGSQKGIDEKPVHQVTINKPFYMGKYEVTQEQWKALMGSNPSHFKGAGSPVENVSWEDCQRLLTRLNEKVEALTFTLPSEAQWEYACRAGSAGEFCFGDAGSGLADYAWYDANAGNTTHPAGRKKPNGWGLYDMYGNVWEWCSDWYADAYPPGEQKDPTGPSSGEFRVLRGGSFLYRPAGCRSAVRYKGPPRALVTDLGLRVAAAPRPVP